MEAPQSVTAERPYYLFAAKLETISPFFKNRGLFSRAAVLGETKAVASHRTPRSLFGRQACSPWLQSSLRDECVAGGWRAVTLCNGGSACSFTAKRRATMPVRVSRVATGGGIAYTGRERLRAGQ